MLEKEEMLVTSMFSFSNSIFQTFFFPAVQNQDRMARSLIMDP